MIRVEENDGHWEIWTEPEEGDVNVGRCIGAGDSLEEAKLCAVRELTTDMRQLDELDAPSSLEGQTGALAAAASAKDEPFIQAAIRHGDHALEFFSYRHLPEPLRFISKQFSAMALDMVNRLPANLERSTMIRKLLEAKDAAVRSRLSKLPAKS